MVGGFAGQLYHTFMIDIDGKVSIPDEEVRVTYIRASGPGGQNVNKVSTAAQLRFDVRRSVSLSAAVKQRLLRLAGARAAKDGTIIITADRFRTQTANRDDAIERLAALIRQALHVPKHRIPTKPSRTARKKRVDSKTKRGAVKRRRSGKIKPDE